MKPLLLLVSHLIVGAIGFAGGIYALPILTAPPSPSSTDLQAHASAAAFTGQFRRDLQGSDFLHWGEGTVSVSPTAIALVGKLAPGPDYKLYLSPEFVETEADFLRLKSDMVRVGEVNTFDNFIVPVPDTVDPDAFTTVIVWCEAFGQFITAAQYR
jgi:hypothetical protein